MYGKEKGCDFAAQQQLVFPKPIPGCGVLGASFPSRTLHYLLRPFLPFPEKGTLEVVGFGASNDLA